MKQSRNRTAGTRDRRTSGEQGFTVIQMVVTVVVATVLLSFSVMGIARVRGSMRLSSASDEFTQYLERARQDSMRRHAESTGAALPSADRTASVTFLDANNYIITMDFNGDGTVEASEQRTVALPDGVSFPASLITAPATTVNFDWRGRPSAEISATLSSAYGSKIVAVSESGSVASYDTDHLNGFELANVPAPAAVPESEFEGGSAEETDAGGDDGKGKDKKGDTPTDPGDTPTDPGGTDTGNDNGNGKDKDKKGDTPTDPGGGDTPGDTPPGDTPPGDTPPTDTPPTDTPPADTNPGNGNGNGNGNDKKNDTPGGGGGTPTASPSPTPTPATPRSCSTNEKPSSTVGGCVCDGGRRVRTNGKCQ